VKPTAVVPTTIPFNRPYVSPDTLETVKAAMFSGETAGNGPFGLRCEAWLEQTLAVGRALLVPSGTAALELAAMLLELEPGDEVVMPSYTFPTTASAFARVGATPVFVDIDDRTQNIDPAAIDAAITARTRAIALVHYGGNACDMDAIQALADTHGLVIVEDAAHAILARHGERWLGSIGAVAALSFHETKNLSCGEGGALLLNDLAMLDRAEILREKGTDRSRFHRGEVDRYTWLDVGSSYVLSEINAAMLWSQFAAADRVTSRRLEIWNAYHAAFADSEASGRVRRPVISDGNRHNGHVYYLLARDLDDRDAIIGQLRERGVYSVFHYVPLHSSPAGRRYGRTHGSLARTDDVAARLLRLPLWAEMAQDDVGRVIDAVCAVLE
jgi:dTDP-4-amino-4,6-dideoxygalactose transaminase